MRLKENIYLPCSTRVQKTQGIKTQPSRGFCLLFFFFFAAGYLLLAFSLETMS